MRQGGYGVGCASSDTVAGLHGLEASRLRRYLIHYLGIDLDETSPDVRCHECLFPVWQLAIMSNDSNNIPAHDMGNKPAQLPGIPDIAAIMYIRLICYEKFVLSKLIPCGPPSSARKFRSFGEHLPHVTNLAHMDEKVDVRERCGESDVFWCADLPRSNRICCTI